MKIITNSKLTHNLTLVSLICGLLAAPLTQALAQTDQDLVEVARSVIKADRQAAVVSAMKLTDEEGARFWPLYHEYRHEMEKISDDLTKLVLEYAKVYPNVPEDRAKEWLKEYIALQKKQVDMRTAYLEKFSKILPAAKALRPPTDVRSPKCPGRPSTRALLYFCAGLSGVTPRAGRTGCRSYWRGWTADALVGTDGRRIGRTDA